MATKKQPTEPAPLGDLTSYQLSLRVEKIAHALRQKPKRVASAKTVAELYQIASFLKTQHFKN